MFFKKNGIIEKAIKKDGCRTDRTCDEFKWRVFDVRDSSMLASFVINQKKFFFFLLRVCVSNTHTGPSNLEVKMVHGPTNLERNL